MNDDEKNALIKSDKLSLCDNFDFIEELFRFVNIKNSLNAYEQNLPRQHPAALKETK